MDQKTNHLKWLPIHLTNFPGPDYTGHPPFAFSLTVFKRNIKCVFKAFRDTAESSK